MSRGYQSRRWHWILSGLAVGLALTGCGSPAPLDATQLSIVTTDAGVDHAVSLAIAEYLGNHDVDVDVTQVANPAEVYTALAETPQTDHELVIGVVTATQEIGVEPVALDVPEELEVIAQAPAELGRVAATSTVTAARFAQHQDAEAAQPLAAACAAQTWLTIHLTPEQLNTTESALEELGCAPMFEAVAEGTSLDRLGQRLTLEHDTVALLYGVDPVIDDRGLATLDVVSDQWPHSSIVAIADPELDSPVIEELNAVLGVLDSNATTALLRSYHNAQLSTSDLQFEVDNAMRYWLANHGLADHDAVVDISATPQ